MVALASLNTAWILLLTKRTVISIICIMVQVSKRGASKSGRCCNGLSDLLSPRLFKALSDTKRISLLVRLAEGRRPCTISELTEGSGIDMSVVSRHLALLREAGIIKCVKRGKEVWCSVEKGGVVQLLRDLADALDACCPDELHQVQGEVVGSTSTQKAKATTR